MEMRNKDLENAWAVQGIRQEKCAKLEEENKKLNKKIMKLQIEIGGLMGERDGLKMVVERLHKELEEQEAEGGGLFDEIDYRKRECKNLKEKVRFLEECLDRKEKVNKKLREEIEDLKKIRDGKDDYIRDLEEKNYELETEIVRLHKEAEYYGVKLS